MALRTTASASSLRVTSAGGGVRPILCMALSILTMASFRSVIELWMTLTCSVSSASFRFGLREFGLARLHPLAGLDQLVVQLRPFFGERRQILA